jgi:hypothetical protein
MLVFFFFLNIANKIKRHTKEKERDFFFFFHWSLPVFFFFFSGLLTSAVSCSNLGLTSAGRATRVKPRVSDRVGLTWRVANDGGRVRRVNLLVARFIAARNVGGAWRRVHRWISSVFAAYSRSVPNLLIGGVGFGDRFLDDVDLELGCSGGV